jgi:hypothetical protein
MRKISDLDDIYDRALPAGLHADLQHIAEKE